MGGFKIYTDALRTLKGNGDTIMKMLKAAEESTAKPRTRLIYLAPKQLFQPQFYARNRVLNPQNFRLHFYYF